MFGRLLTLPFIFGLALCYFLTWKGYGSHYAMWMIPQGVLLALVVVFLPQINWWWYCKYPPNLDDVVVKWLETYHRFYKELSPENKIIFRQRLALYLMAIKFIGRNEEEQIEYDVQAIIASNIIHITFGMDNFLTGKFEHIVVYHGAFPSPEYPHTWHYSELYEQDGVLLFSRDQVINAFIQDPRVFQVGLYEFARVLFIINPHWEIPSLEDENIEVLQEISSMANGDVKNTIGLEEIDWRAVATHHFLRFPEKMESKLPEYYKILQRALRLNPKNRPNPKDS